MEVALARESPSANSLTLKFKHAGKLYELTIDLSDRISDLKDSIYSLTRVTPSRQKLLNLVKGKQPSDDMEISFLNLSHKEFMVVGTPEGEEVIGISLGAFDDDAAADVDVDYTETEKEAYRATQSIRNRRKLAEASKAVRFNIMSAPRPDKKLLVLDLDYCILDTSLWKEPTTFDTSRFVRPFLHQFLSAVSPYWDIVIWSQTSWRYLEQKLLELGLVGGTASYPIVFVLDRTNMFSIWGEKDSKPLKHSVKALGVIWDSFPQYSKKNTIHVDDLARNFAMNPRNGLRVHAYKDAMKTRSSDRELLFVARYLLQLSLHPDFSADSLDHKHFRTYPGILPPGEADPTQLQNP